MTLGNQHQVQLGSGLSLVTGRGRRVGPCHVVSEKQPCRLGCHHHPPPPITAAGTGRERRVLAVCPLGRCFSGACE